MSLSDRLRRLLRAQVGDWLRNDPDPPAIDPDDVTWDMPSGDDPDSDAASGSDAASNSESPSPPRGPDGQPIPPDVVQAYRALEVPVGSDRATVKKGYRRVMKQYHQDRFANDPDKRDVAGEVSKRLNSACERVLAYLDRVA